MKTKKWLAICVLPGLALMAGCGKKESGGAARGSGGGGSRARGNSD